MFRRRSYEMVRTLVVWANSRFGCRPEVVLHPEPLIWGVQVGVFMMANEEIDQESTVANAVWVHGQCVLKCTSHKPPFVVPADEEQMIIA